MPHNLADLKPLNLMKHSTRIVSSLNKSPQREISDRDVGNVHNDSQHGGFDNPLQNDKSRLSNAMHPIEN